MKIDDDRDLIVRIDAKLHWINSSRDTQEQIMRDTMNHQIQAMGNRLEYSVATIIKSMCDQLSKSRAPPQDEPPPTA